MARTKTKTTKSVSSKASTSAKPAPTVASLLERASSLIASCEYDLALKFIHRTLESQSLTPDEEADALDMLGVIQLEIGDVQEAYETFTRLSQHTKAPASAFLYLGQLTAPVEPHIALSHYQRAIDLLTPIQTASTTTTIVRAYVSMVEIHMDPSHSLCEEDGAAERCTSLLALALTIAPNHSEALQALASVRLSESNPEAAGELVTQAYELWRYLDANDDAVPQLATRMNMSKLFVEVGKYDEADEILTQILKEDDEDVEAWYLSGWTQFLQAQVQREAGKVEDEWREDAQDARLSLETCRTLFLRIKYDDPPILEHVNELIAELETWGILHEVEDDADRAGAWVDGWEDADSEEEDVDMVE